MKESWKPISGYDGFYEVSNFGKVRSINRNVYHTSNKCMMNRSGRVLADGPYGAYKSVALCKDGGTDVRHVHVLVLEAFSGSRQSGMQCRHLNGNKLDNRIENLRWGTRAENEHDKIALGEILMGEDHGCAKVTEEEVRLIRRLRDRAGTTYKDLGAMFGLTASGIYRIVKRKTWAWLED